VVRAIPSALRQVVHVDRSLELVVPVGANNHPCAVMADAGCLAKLNPVAPIVAGRGQRPFSPDLHAAASDAGASKRAHDKGR
jgi:hypothetical protein